MKFPHVNLDTNKIFNCKKGSRIWWHEKGHIEYNKLEISGRLYILQHLFFIIWMFAVTLSHFNSYMLILSLPCLIFYVGVEVYEESWCNEYANKHLKTIKT